MADKKIISGYEVYTIISANGHTRASFVPEKGGVGCSIIMPWLKGEREILFLHDNFWEKHGFDLQGGWPFLFPICGRLKRMGANGNYLYDGHLYNLPIHGFAPYAAWQVLSSESKDSLVLEFTHTKDTLAMFPFSFKVELAYKVVDGSLICEQTYTNTDDKAMPYYAGFHPYFLTPEPGKGKEEVMLNFSPTRLFRYNESLTDLIGEKTLFNLPVSVTDPHINEQLTQVSENNIVDIEFPDGFQLFMKSKTIKTANLFGYIQIYTMPNKPFICIEPWMAFPNALNTVAGVRWLKPGKSEKGIIELSSTCIKDTCCVLSGG